MYHHGWGDVAARLHASAIVIIINTNLTHSCCDVHETGVYVSSVP